METQGDMRVRDCMAEVPDTVGPGHTVRHAAGLMSDRGVGAAIVIDPEEPGPGILTERDVLRMVATGGDLDAELVGDRATAGAVSATAEWSLDEAAETMIKGGFRHLVVVDGGDLIGVVAMRDIVRAWVEHGGPRLEAPVHEVMSTDILTTSADATLAEAARAMAERKVGAAVVAEGDAGPGVLTERDVLKAVAASGAEGARVSEHLTAEPVCAEPDWTLRQAAEAMVEGGFRHLIVLEDDRPAGVLSVRDVVRHATDAEGSP